METMEIGQHLRITGGALKRWFIAQSKDALAVGVIWLVGLLIIGVPWAPLWAVIGGLLQYIPNIGPVVALIPVCIAVAVTAGGWWMLLEVLILYAVIAVVDGLVLQPWIMKHTTRVPIWASIIFPIMLGLLFNFWGVLLSAPLLSVIWAYKSRNTGPEVRDQDVAVSSKR
jgi:predicted PurR-regulated permease PerM